MKVHRTRDFFLHLFRAYPARTSMVVGLLTVGGLMEGLGIVTLLPLVEVASAPSVDSAPSEVGRTLSRLLGLVGLTPTLPVLVVLLVTAMTLKAVMLWLAMREAGYAVGQVTLELRLKLLRALLKARWRYFGHRPVGEYAAAMGPESIRAASAYREACGVFAGVVQVTMYLMVATLISWQVTALAIVSGAMMAFGLRGLVDMGRSAGQQQTKWTKSLVVRMVEALQGMRPIKAMAKEDLYGPLLEKEAEALNVAHRRQVVATEGITLVHEPIVTLILGVGLWVLLAVADWPFATVIVMAFIFHRVMANINTVLMRYQITTIGESAFWAILDQIEDAEEEEEVHSGSIVPAGLNDGIEFRNVAFSYPDRALFTDLNLDLPAGSFTAVIGPSGSGKTTIADLVSGPHRPESGEVLVDGVPMSDIDLMAWWSLIGYVPRDVFLFNDTVLRNVTMGDETITHAEVEQALREADALEFVQERGGLDFVLAPQGSNLSGGQRQRLAIARALVKSPALLILDEATTALDTRTEAEICQTLVYLRGRVTILAISHQLALREAADTVFELVDGEVVEMVTPKHGNGKPAVAAQTGSGVFR